MPKGRRSCFCFCCCSYCKKKKKDQLEGVDDQDLIVKLHCYFAHFSLLLPFLFAYMVLFEEIYEDFTFFFLVFQWFPWVSKGFLRDSSWNWVLGNISLHSISKLIWNDWNKGLQPISQTLSMIYNFAMFMFVFLISLRISHMKIWKQAFQPKTSRLLLNTKFPSE